MNQEDSSRSSPTPNASHPSQNQSDAASGSRPIRAKKKYIPAVTPRLRIALTFVFILFALLAANSFYLLSITVLGSVTQRSYENLFYLWMFLLHLVLGILLITPFLIFAFYHLLATRKRKNRRAVRVGYALLVCCLVLLFSGVLLVRVGSFGVNGQLARNLVYLAHVITPLAAIWLYWLHRLAGPPIKWRVGLTYAGVVGVILIPMIFLQFQDPREWSVAGSPEGKKYFEPSSAVTASGNFIPQANIHNDEYCLKCHQDVHESWAHSAHRFSSFNNPAYLTSIVELREQLMARDGNVKASRWCAGCHDPVPFFSGKFDDPNYDVFSDPTASAGITCTSCHAITNINSNIGNADYTIEEPIHYPFAFSENPVLQWINNQLVKAKPGFHKKVMLKPLHQTAEFCATCHKVSLPGELTEYKDFLRGQNHYDTWLLSGVSGHGVQSFYYPPQAEVDCNRCHMPLLESNEFASRDFDNSGKLSVHSHLFPSANTALAWLREQPEIVEEHREFLDGVMRIDLFGIKEGDRIEKPVQGPLRPLVPTLKPGETYLLETVIRTVKMGHAFTQGTADSNEIWVDLTVIESAEYDQTTGERIGGRIVGRSGGLDDTKAVDPWAHYVNVFMLDRYGNRINRRNAADIFVPLYNHQIPPGAGQVVHYRLVVPEDIQGPLTVEAKLKFRKFDQEYMQIISDFHQANERPLRGEQVNGEYINDLPVTTLATDRIHFPIEGIAAEVANDLRDDIPVWQRWNDYGIGLLTAGNSMGMRGELLQAKQAFEQVEALERFDGPVNLARVYLQEGDAAAMNEALERAITHEDAEGFPHWTVHWLLGEVENLNGNLEKAVGHFDAALNFSDEETLAKNFDFSLDYRLINAVGLAYSRLADDEYRRENEEQAQAYFELARDAFERTLTLDEENVTAHDRLAYVYENLNEPELAAEHRAEHQKYKVDGNASDTAIAAARARYPAANRAAEAVVIYLLNRPGAYELPPEAYLEEPGEASSDAQESTTSTDAPDASASPE